MSRTRPPRRPSVRSIGKALRLRRAFGPGVEAFEDRLLLSAFTFTVNSLGDTGGGSGAFGDLRYAITQANSNPGSTIEFGIAGTIKLASALPDISADVTIEGPGRGTLTVQAGGAAGNFRVFTVDSGVHATISGLTITGGAADTGGGISNAGTLSLISSQVSGNSAATSGGGIANSGVLKLVRSNITGDTSGGSGGGIANSGKLTLSYDSFTGNTASGAGGGLYNAPAATADALDSAFSGNAAQNGGGIANEGTCTLTNNTISGNSSSQNGAGISNAGALTLTNDTVTANGAAVGFGGGVQNTVAGQLLLNNSLIAGNLGSASQVGPNNIPGDVEGTVDSTSAYNLIGDGDHLTGISNGSQGNQIGSASAGTVINAGLLPHDNYGGPTRTVALLPTSPALNAGNTALAVDPSTGHALVTDQRGWGFDRQLHGAVDIGAYESSAAPASGTVYTVNSLGDTGAGSGTSGDLRYAITQANAHPGSTIVFSVTGTITITAKLLGIDADVTIAGPGKDLLTIECGSYLIYALAIGQRTVARISGVTISEQRLDGSTSGRASEIINYGTLEMADSVLTGTLTVGLPGQPQANLDNRGVAALTRVEISGITGRAINNTVAPYQGSYTQSLTLDSCVIENNTAGTGFRTGAAIIASNGFLTITNSTIAGNTILPKQPDDLSPYRDGVILLQGTSALQKASLTLTNSTLSGNSVLTGATIDATLSSLAMSNDTIAGNTGRGISGIGSTAEINNSTVTGNGGAGLYGHDFSVSIPNTITLNNCLIAGNATSGTAPVGDIVGAVQASSSNNLIGNGDALQGLTNGTHGNQIGSAQALTTIDPKLGPVAGNGGSTQTEALLAGSPALNAGGNSSAVDPATGHPLSGDQRGVGFARIGRGTVDIGAYEFQASATHATQLVATQVPTTAYAGNGFDLTFAAEDASGHVDLGFNGPVLLQLTNNPGGSSFNGSVAAYAAQGVVDFSNLILDKPGSGYAFTATADGLPSSSTGPIDVVYAAANVLVITSTPPGTFTAGTAFGMTVVAEDGAGHIATNFTGTINVATLDTTRPGGNPLQGTTAVQAVNGVATFSDLTWDYVDTADIQATSAGLQSVIGYQAHIQAGAIAKVVVAVQPPASIAANQNFGLTVNVTDRFGNLVTNYNSDVTVVLAANPAGGKLGGVVTVKAAGGVATFTKLTLTKPGSGYELESTAAGITSEATDPITVTYPATNHLVTTTEPPANVGVGQSFGLTLTAADASGNTITTYSGLVTVQIADNPGGAILGGTTTVNAVNGVATFTDLKLNQLGVGYTLVATSSGLLSVTTRAFNVAPAATATKLVTTAQPPPSVSVNRPFSFSVTAEDDSGKIDTSFSGNVTVALGANPGGATTGGTLTVTAAYGVATFNDVTLDEPGNGYTIVASTSGLTSATTDTIDAVPLQATELAVTKQPPASVTQGAAFTVTFTAENSVGAVDTSYTGPITLALGTNPGGATLGGTLTIDAVSGVATFNDLTVNHPGNGYTLVATAPGLSSATTSAFNVTPVTATRLVVTTQPPSTVQANSGFGLVVKAEDPDGNVDTNFHGSVTLAIAANPGGAALGGTLVVNAVNGLATFSGVTLNKARNGYTLVASASGLNGGFTNAINVTVTGPALHVVSITPGDGKYSALPSGKIVVKFNTKLAGLTPDDPTGGGFASYPHAVSLIPRGPSGTFSAPSGIDSGSIAVPATLVYHVNKDGTSTITLTPRAPLGTDVYQISVSGKLMTSGGASLTDASGHTGTEYRSFTLKTTVPNSISLKIVSVTTQHASVNITNGATIVQPDTIAIAFNKQVDFLQLNKNTVRLFAGTSQTPIKAAVAYSPTTKTVYLTPEDVLAPGTKYTIRVAGSLSDAQAFPRPDAAYTLGKEFTRSFQVKTAGTGPGTGPLVALSKNGHLLASPGNGPARKSPFGYASIPFSETIGMNSLSRSSVRLVPQAGGLNNNGADAADSSLNARIAFNPNTNTMIIVPTVLTGNGVYRYYLGTMKAINGDPLTNPGGQLPVTDSFSVAVPSKQPAVQSQTTHVNSVTAAVVSEPATTQSGVNSHAAVTNASFLPGIGGHHRARQWVPDGPRTLVRRGW